MPTNEEKRVTELQAKIRNVDEERELQLLLRQGVARTDADRDGFPSAETVRNAQESGRSVTDQAAAEAKDKLERSKRETPPVVQGDHVKLPSDLAKDGTIPGKSGG